MQRDCHQAPHKPLGYDRSRDRFVELLQGLGEFKYERFAGLLSAIDPGRSLCFASHRKAGRGEAGGSHA
jgi:hypothetical protein